jgi:SNF2 family DNA or RNA helicase
MNYKNECYIFYDKYGGGSHGFKNTLTKKYTIKELFETKTEGENCTYLTGDDAVTKYNAKFGATNFRMPVGINNDIITIHTFFFMDETNCEIIISIVGFFIPKLVKYYEDNKTIPNSDFVFNACRYHINYEGTISIEMNDTSKTVKAITDKVIVPNSDIMDPIIDNPDFINTTKKLYDYQRRTIKWMVETEKNPQKVHYGTNYSFELEIGPLVFDIIKNVLVMKNSQEYIRFGGGALIDEVGLGKTIQTLTTCILNPPSVNNLSYIDEKRNMLRSGATLILCPNHLAKQWIRELSSMITRTGFKIVEMLTKNHFDKYTYLDLLEADFVVISYTFIGNNCFSDKYTKTISTSKSYHKSSAWNAIAVEEVFKKMAAELVKKPTSLFETKALFPLIYWYRVVIDEFHEPYTVKKYSFVKNIIPHIKGNFKWAVTGTPFDKDTTCFYKMLDFVTQYKSNLGDKIINVNDVKDHMMNNFFRRNTKKSVEEEFKLPELKEKIVWLRFTHTERMMYNAYLSDPNVNRFSEIIRQICCHPKIADEIKGVLSKCKTMKDVEKSMVAHYKRQHDIALRNVKRCEKYIAKTNRRILITEYKRQRKYLKIKGYNAPIDIEPFEFKDEHLLTVVDDVVDETADIEDDDTDKKDKKNQKDKEKGKGKDIQKDMQDENNIDEIEDDNNDALNIENLSDDDDTKETITVNAENQKKIMSLIKNYLDRNPSMIIQNYQATLRLQKERLTNLEKIFNGKKTQYDFFNNMLKRIKKFTERSTAKYERLLEKNRKKDELGDEYVSSDEEEEENDDDKCLICMDEITGEDVGVTKCGHLFCFECLKTSVADTGKCPMCLKPQTNKDISMISFEKPVFTKQNSEILKNKMELIDQVGTKLTNLIYYLKSIPDNVIIYSQWDSLLRKVGDVLADHGLENRFCRGNIWSRDKAIRDFTNDNKVKCIMLSSESAASGANLTKASKVILLDPVSGDYEYRRNMEWQAIGRAYRLGQQNSVEIVRFIIKDTVEEEIYKTNKIEDAKQKTQLNISEVSDETITISDEKLRSIAEAMKQAKVVREQRKKDRESRAEKRKNIKTAKKNGEIVKDKLVKIVRKTQAPAKNRAKK